MKKRLIGAIAGFATVFAVFAAIALADGEKDSVVTLNVAKTGFSGNVDSKTKQCVEGRTVKVIKRKHRRETKIGTTVTGPEGNWILPRKSVKPGVYLAKVRRTDDGSETGIYCGGDRSGKVVFGK